MPSHLLLLLLLLLLFVAVSRGESASGWSLTPLRYDVELLPIFDFGTDVDFHLITRTKIFAKVDSETDRFSLYSHAAIENLSVTVEQENRQFRLESFERNNLAGAYEIVLSRNLSTDANVTIRIGRAVENFTTFNSTFSNFVYMKYRGEADNVTRLDAFSTAGSRLMFPYITWRFASSASFCFAVYRRSDFVVVANTPSIRNLTVTESTIFDVGLTGEWVKEEFAETPKISAEFVGVSMLRPSPGRRCFFDGRHCWYCVWVESELAETAELSLRRVARVVQFLEDRLDAKLPIDRIDFVVSDGTPLSVDIQYGMKRTLGQTFTDGSTAKFMVGSMVMHWFGYEVKMSCNEVGLLFLGLSFNLQNYAWSKIQANGSSDVDADTLQLMWGRLAGLDELPAGTKQLFSSRLMQYFPVSTIRQLGFWIGEETLINATAEFLRNNSGKGVCLNDFYRVLQANGVKQVQIDAFDTSLNMAGIPMINTTVLDGQLLLTQSRFLRNRLANTIRNKNPDNSSWILSVTMVTSDNCTLWDGKSVKNFTQWMTKDEQNFSSFPASSPPSWYLLNALSAGNYRVNYDTKNWRDIVAQFQIDSTVFTYQDTKRIIDDAFELAFAGYIEFSVPMNLTRCIINNTDNYRVAIQVWYCLHELVKIVNDNETMTIYSRYLCQNLQLLERVAEQLKQSVDDAYNGIRARLLLKSFNETCSTNKDFEVKKFEFGLEDQQRFELYNWLIDNV